MTATLPRVRVTGVLVEDGCLLLLHQAVTESSDRSWSLPGGGLEFGESLESCLIREMEEETGLDVTVDRLLYVADRIQDGRHIVHMTFLVSRLDGEIRVGLEPEDDANPIRAVEMVPLDGLVARGFSERFQALAAKGFPGSGSYMGEIENIGL